MNASTTYQPGMPRDAHRSTLEHSGFRWAYLLLSFGLLVSVAYRGFVRQESSWDLLALVLLGGLVSAWDHRGRARTLTPGWALAALVAMVSALFLGAVLVLVAR